MTQCQQQKHVLFMSFMNNLKHTHTISLTLGPALFPHTHEVSSSYTEFQPVPHHLKLEFLRGKVIIFNLTY